MIRACGWLSCLVAVLVVGCTPDPEQVVAAARRGDVATVERGLRADGPHLERALEEAICGGRAEVVRLLLVNGVEPDSAMYRIWARQSRAGDSAAPLVRSDAVLELVHGRTGPNKSVLDQAIRGGDAALVRRLLRDGSPDDLAEVVGPAVVQRRYEVLQVLLDHSVERGALMLHATRAGDVRAVGMVLDAGCDPSLALLMAVEGEDVPHREDVVRRILEAGPRGHGEPLVEASSRGQLEVVRLLLGHPELVRNLETATERARRNGRTDVVGVLEDHRRQLPP